MSEASSPRVRSIVWGELDVDGFGKLKDAKLFPGGAREWDWAQTGTRHSPGIQPSDVAELIDAGATENVLDSREAVRVYNELAWSIPVGALIHSTC